jgi:hypothetical protein
MILDPFWVTRLPHTSNFQRTRNGKRQHHHPGTPVTFVKPQTGPLVTSVSWQPISPIIFNQAASPLRNHRLPFDDPPNLLALPSRQAPFYLLRID